MKNKKFYIIVSTVIFSFLLQDMPNSQIIYASQHFLSPHLFSSVKFD